MRTSRKLAIGALGAVALLLGLLLVVPYAFRGRIESRLRAAINDGVEAHVDWRGVGLSLLRDFPDVTLSMDRPSVVGSGVFAGDTLLVVSKARLTLGLGSVVGYLRHGAPIVIREIALVDPSVDLRVLPDGTANWNITRPTPSSGGPSRDVAITLRSLRITGGALRLDDRHSQLAASVHGLDETLSGDFAKTRFQLVTRTRADSVFLRFAGTPYLSRVALALDADIDADLAAHRFTFRRDTLRLNALALGFDGSVATGSPDMMLDVAFKAPSTAFKDILSLVPAIYARDFASLQASGTMAVSGQVRGAYGPHAFPALALRARVEDGAFRYPSLPLPARDIAMELAIDNPGGHVDSTVVALRRLHAVIGGRPLDAHLVVRTPVSDPDVDLAVRGGVNLADVARTVKLDGVRELSGLVAADFAVHARQSDVDARRADRVTASGSLDLSHVAVLSTGLPRGLRVDTGAIRFTPASQRLAALAVRYGKSDARMTGSLENLIGYVLRNQDLRGTASLTSGAVNLDELVPQDSSSSNIAVPARLNLALDASVARVTYGKLVASDVRGGMHVKDQRVTLDALRLRAVGGGVTASGWYDTVVPARPGFDVSFALDSLDVPSAYAALVTVQKLAPVARWAQGRVSGATHLRGTLGPSMTPEFSTLTGDGTISSDRLSLQGVPLLGRLADATKIESLRNPALGALQATFSVADGRVAVRPFTVDAAGIALTIGGSHGLDQSLRYDIGIAAPRALLGSAANDAIGRLAARAGTPVAAVAQAPVVRLGAQVTGTVTDPRVAVNFAGTAQSARDAVTAALKEAAAARVAAVRQAGDSAVDAARRRASAEADRIVAAASRQADSIRAGARELAARAQLEANARADSLVARATNPLAKRVAQAGADRLRKEGEQQANRMIQDADARADSVVAQAKRRADALAPPPK